MKLGILRSGLRILDIGSGLGHIMAAVRDRLPGCVITCVEAAPKSVAYLRRNGFTVVEEVPTLTRSAPYDLIFMVEVIEHLDDPSAVLRQCHTVLGEGGKIFLTTPSGELRSGSRSTEAYATPEHVQFFTKSSLSLAVEIAGFTSLDFFEMRAFHAGSSIAAIKWIKDSLRIARNWAQGAHHFVSLIHK
jgi:SAM-dependent methyltransferase